jgi:SAM-dependent methyltransferase
VGKRFENFDNETTNVEFYRNFAPFYLRYYGNVNPCTVVKNWAARLEALGLIPAETSKDERDKMRLIDVGCGPGLYLPEWAREGFQITGLDSSSTMINFAENHIRKNCPDRVCQLIQADIREIGEKNYDRQFDLAVSHFNFLNLFSADQLTPVFKGVWSLLRPGGAWMTDFCELTGELEDIQCSESTRKSEYCIRYSERFYSEEGIVEIRWVGEQFDMIERYWLKNTLAIRRSAEEVGFHVIFIKKRCLNKQSQSLNSDTFIHQLITIFVKSSGNGHPEPKNLEDRSDSARLF